jgi:Uma2 family endonuclease
MEPKLMSPAPVVSLEQDQRVYLRGLSWSDFEDLLRMRGERLPRVTYLEGTLELMSPSREHERLESLLGRLLEAYAEERELQLDAFGSWLVKEPGAEAGVEPDECYVLGGREVDVPDLAIEIVWTSGALDKLDVYRRLGVREVWFWRAGRLEVFVLEREGYRESPASDLLPGLDLGLLAGFLGAEDQTAAVRVFRRRLRGE